AVSAHDLRERAPPLPGPADVQPDGAPADGRGCGGVEHGGAVLSAHSAGRLSLRPPAQHPPRPARAGGGAPHAPCALTARAADQPPPGPAAAGHRARGMAAAAAGGVDRSAVLPAFDYRAAAAAVVLAERSS